MKRTRWRKAGGVAWIAASARAVAVGVLLFGAGAPAQAQPVELTPFIGYRVFGSLTDWTGQNISTDDAMSYGGYATFASGREFAVELGFSRQDTDVRLSQPFQGQTRYDVKLDTWTLGARQTFFRRRSNVLPYGAYFAGLSHMSSADSPESVTKFMMGLGGGARVMAPSGRFGLRLGARGYFTFAGGGGGSIGCGVGGCAFGVSSQAFFQMDLLGGVTFVLGGS